MKYDGHAEIVLKDVIIDIASSDTTIFERKAFDISSRDTFRSPGGKNEEIELHDDDHVMEIDSGNMTALTTPQGSASSYETSRQSLSPAILNKATEEYQDGVDQRMPSLTGSYYCHICLEWEGTESKGFCLPCGHSFCRACLESFLAANIIDANTSLRCFHPLEPNPSAPSVEASERFGDEEETGSEPQLRVCNAEIDEDTILEILRDKEILHKYTRFKFMKQNPDSRECPKCGEFNTTGSAQKTQLICSNALCLQEFCFLHGDAHPTESCLQYSSRESVDSKASLELIASLAKSCPGCGVSILKSGGCNHMKCPHCRQAFCWLCLQV